MDWVWRTSQCHISTMKEASLENCLWKRTTIEVSSLKIFGSYAL
ncbi:hypothetical protein LEMLEM_LOCUS1971 [Lemmus lemmus]